MIDLRKEWSISFAGCGFMGIYYVGASSCILERFPRFIQDASNIYGASAAYNLLQIVQDSLLRNLPEDAHVRASGKLCVSLTRSSGGKNVLVSEFDSKEELQQVSWTWTGKAV